MTVKSSSSEAAARAAQEAARRAQPVPGFYLPQFLNLPD